MKILHVSTSSSGGAWVSATNLVNLQQEAGINAQLVTLSDLQDERNILRLIIGKLNTLYSKIIAKKEYEFLSIHSASADLIPYLRRVNPDVVHIHNWFNMITYDEISTIGNEFPLFFTMHDSRLATGGCHIPYECKNYIQKCNKCPAVKFETLRVSEAKQKTEKAVASCKAFAIVSPTEWILAQAIQSGITAHSMISEIIPNIVPLRLIKKQTKLSSATTRILFVAANLNSKTKGFETLLSSIEALAESGISIEFNVIGSGKIKRNKEVDSKFKLIAHGMLSKKDTLELMSNVDLLCVPSTSENFPNVILEAFSVGLIVVASEVGGIPEMVTHNETGYLFNGTISDLTKTLRTAISDKDNWDYISDNALAKLQHTFRNETSIERTIELYKMLIKKFAEVEPM